MRCHLFFNSVPVFIIMGCLLLGVVEVRPRPGVKPTRNRVEIRSASGEVIPWATSRSRSPGIGRLWKKCHGRFVREVEVADSQEGFDLIFYGDSITEAWRGTFMGSSWTMYKQVPKVWNQFFAERYRAVAFGISGDKIGNLMWRLIHGELPIKRSPKVIILLIGTNDVEGARCNLDNALKTADRLRLLVNHVHSRHPTTHIVVLGLLPKGEDWPNMCSSALQAVNGKLQGLAANSSQIHFMDLTNDFVMRGNTDKWEINETSFVYGVTVGVVDEQLLPDTLHPSRLGMERIAKALEPLIDRLLSAGFPAPAPAPFGRNPETQGQENSVPL